jgi:uncharacterized protein YqhQ
MKKQTTEYRPENLYSVFLWIKSMGEPSKMMVGGQAVLEGVMMRSAEFITVAVRKPNGRIVLKKEAFKSWTRRFRILGWPFVRGGVVLIESLVMGIKALNFSGNIAMEEEISKNSGKQKSDSKKSRSQQGGDLQMIVPFIIAFGLGIGLFFYVPLLLTNLTGVKNGIAFNLIDGFIRMIFFLTYLLMISMWKDIRRVFQYHGAEHKSIFAYENRKPLTLENVKAYTTQHPRCGTSFLVMVVLVSILVFMPFGRPETVGERLFRLLLIPLIGGISYEVIRLSNSRAGQKFARILIAPGLWLQRITTQEPDDSQIEVALVALRAALNDEVGAEVEWFIPENNGKQ